MKIISTRRLKKDISLLISFVKEHPLESLAQVTIPLYTIANYMTDHRNENPDDGSVYKFEKRTKRFTWDVAKGLAWYFGMCYLIEK